MKTFIRISGFLCGITLTTFVWYMGGWDFTRGDGGGSWAVFTIIVGCLIGEGFVTEYKKHLSR